jgi:hypothetical protein
MKFSGKSELMLTYLLPNSECIKVTAKKHGQEFAWEGDDMIVAITVEVPTDPTHKTIIPELAFDNRLFFLGEALSIAWGFIKVDSPNRQATHYFTGNNWNDALNKGMDYIKSEIVALAECVQNRKTILEGADFED